ncbi:YcgL domain-containing protein [Microbulbifer sp. OS29]|uniref:YcgL domain-containing protein MO867_04620 n=1 Tax=Microbulbifer okhotskensis TaxID=2926617 RepID=A0A9X2EM53_9GAMM|nr:YcgL domain-containing protein [Microbulbifer okhotskensis]MCO1333620.1 YcgL domain-containing protein [Microbulbifer okhotskensis]
MRILCDIYRSPSKEEMYLYVDKREGISRIPDNLLELFGSPKHVTTMLMTADKKLARANAAKVLEEVRARGYYLQMPLVEDSEMREIALKNSKLQR